MTRSTDYDLGSLSPDAGHATARACPAQARAAVASCGRTALSDTSPTDAPELSRTADSVERVVGWWAFCAQARSVGASV